MFSLSFRRFFPHVVTLVLTLSPSLSNSGPSQSDVGMLVKLNWNTGDVHSEQSRWQTNVALGSTASILRSTYATGSIDDTAHTTFEDEPFKGYYQELSLLPIQWSLDSTGNSFGKLYGFPVVTKLSPVFNASETNTESGSTIVSNPWMWVGAAAVGLAAVAGGSGGGSSSGGSGNGGGTEVNVLSGQGGEGCNVVSGEDPTSVEVVSGC